MSGAGYDVVVDVDDEVTPGSPVHAAWRLVTTEKANFVDQGRPRTHRPPRRQPRVPQLQLYRRRVRAERRGGPVPRPAAAGDGVVVLWRRRRGRRQAVSVDHVLLRAVLRRRHLVRPPTVLGGAVPARQLPRRARGQPGPVRAVLDRDHGRADTVLGGHHQPVLAQRCR
jgi:hypothetical protein